MTVSLSFCIVIEKNIYYDWFSNTSIFLWTKNEKYILLSIKLRLKNIKSKSQERSPDKRSIDCFPKKKLLYK